MAVTLTKKAKPAAKTAVPPAKATPATKLAAGEIKGYEEKVDRLVEIEKALAAIPDVSKLLADRTKIEGELRKIASEVLPADEGGKFPGTLKDFVVGPRGNAREIKDLTEVRKALGDETFFKIAKVTLTDLDKYLTEVQKAALIESKQEGNRPATLEPRPAL